MKSIALVLFFVAFVAAQSGDITTVQKVFLSGLRAQCRMSLGVSLAEEDQIRAEEFSKLSEKQNCLIKCMTDKVNFTNAKGEINVAALHKLLDPVIGVEKATLVDKTCDHLGADLSPCARTAAVYACHAKMNAVFLFKNVM